MGMSEIGQMGQMSQMSQTRRTESSEHPEERALARWAESGADPSVEEHLRWCARCRSAAADYRWLEQEVGAALAEAADAAPVPRPKWWEVRGRLFAGQPHPGSVWRASVVVGAVLIFCQAIALPPAASPALAVDPATAPPPVVALVSRAPGSASLSTDAVEPMATPTPNASLDAEDGADGETRAAPSPTLAPVLPPRPGGTSPKPQVPSPSSGK